MQTLQDNLTEILSAENIIARNYNSDYFNIQRGLTNAAEPHVFFCNHLGPYGVPVFFTTSTIILNQKAWQNKALFFPINSKNNQLTRFNLNCPLNDFISILNALIPPYNRTLKYYEI